MRLADWSTGEVGSQKAFKIQVWNILKMMALFTEKQVFVSILLNY